MVAVDNGPYRFPATVGGPKDRSRLRLITGRTWEDWIPFVRPGSLATWGEQLKSLFGWKSDVNRAGQTDPSTPRGAQETWRSTSLCSCSE